MHIPPHTGKKRKKKIRKGLAYLTILLCCLSIISGALAFFTDRVTQSAGSTAGNIDLVFHDISASKSGTNNITSPNEYAIDKAWKTESLVSSPNIINPGDYFDLSYKLANTGNKSIDVRQMLTVISSVAMDTAEGYTLTITGQNYNSTTVTGTLSEDGKTMTYVLDDIILNGTGTSAEMEDGVTWAEQKYIIRFDFLNMSGNAFQGADVSASLDIQAKQHRNTTDADWAPWAEYTTKYEQIINFSDGPALSLNELVGTSRENPVFTEDRTYTVSGTVASEDNSLKTVTVNGKEVTVNPDGSWSTTLTLVAGKINEICVVATDNIGNGTSVTEYIYCMDKAYALILDNSADSSNAVPMIFVRSETDISAGDVYESKTYGNRTVTAAYTGFETAAYAFSTSTGKSNTPWNANASKVTSVVIEDKIKPASTAGWFAMFTQAVDFDMRNLDVSQVTNMSYMFYACGNKSSAPSFSITGLDTWDTANVTDMTGVFTGTGAFASTWSLGDISGWNTASVSTMEGMFASSGYRADHWSLDLRGWDVTSVQNMASMFAHAGRNADAFTLTGILSWDTRNVQNMSSMFYYTAPSASYMLDLSAWDVRNVKSHSAFNTSAEGKVTPPIWEN